MNNINKYNKYSTYIGHINRGCLTGARNTSSVCYINVKQ